MAAHIKAATQLSKSISEEARSRTIFDPEMRRLRAALRAECEAALLADLRLAQAVRHKQRLDLEQLLWRAAFYRVIEEFRQRIRSGQGELKAKTELAFHAFLQDGQAFYLQLAARLQQRYGDAGFPLPLIEQQLAALGRALEGVEPAASRSDCRTSVQRCLICLGDLARYGEGAAPPAERDWATCRSFYRLAARVAPEEGNAYNQLAVLASYEGDDLAATFFYCRALATTRPFEVAKENLVTHFEKNRVACQRLGGDGGGGGGGRGMRPASKALRELRLRSTRVLGMLLTRSDLDGFPQALAAALAGAPPRNACPAPAPAATRRSAPALPRAGTGPRAPLRRPPACRADVDDHAQRARQQGRKAAAAAAGDDTPPPLLLLAAVAVYAVHVASGGSGGGPDGLRTAAAAATVPAGAATFSAAVQQQQARRLALQLVCSLAARLAAATAAATAAVQHGALGGAAGPLLLPPLRLLLAWLAAAGGDALLPSQQEPPELTAARQQLWQACAELVPLLRAAAAAAAGEPGGEPGGGQAQAAGSAWLPEDAQLAGFRHVSPCAAPPATSAPDAADPLSGAAALARAQRLLADAAAAARALAAGAGPGGPPALAAAQATFVAAALAGEPPPPAQPQPSWLPQQAAGPLASPQPAGTGPAPALPVGMDLDPAAAQPHSPLPSAALAAAAPGAAEQQATEEAEEEVIVYSPQPPPAAALTPPPRLLRSEPPPPPQQQPQQQQQARPLLAAPAAGPAAGVDADMADAELTAQAVAGSVLPEPDRRASPPPAAAPWLPSHAEPAAAAPAGPAGPQAAGGLALPAEFFSLLGDQQAQQAQQQAQPQAAGAQAVPPALAPVAAAAAAAGQQQQAAAGLRALLFGIGSGGTPGGTGGSQPPPQPVSLAAPSHAPPPAPAPPAPAEPAAGGALLSGGTAADRWAWMGAFGGGDSPAAAPAGSAGPALPRTDNPFVP